MDSQIDKKDDVYHRITKDHVLSENDKNLIFCPICLDVMQNVVETNCGHVFCKNCLDITTKEANIRKCPCCKENITKINDSAFFNRIIQNVKIECCNGCSCVLTISELTKHISVCKKEKIQCTYCNKTGERENIETHTILCASMEAKCEKCGVMCKMHEMKEHDLFVCDDVVIDCRFKFTLGCNFKCKRKDMPEHEKDSKVHTNIKDVLGDTYDDDTLVGAYISVFDESGNCYEPCIILKQNKEMIYIKFLRWVGNKYNKWINIRKQINIISEFENFNDIKFANNLDTIKINTRGQFNALIKHSGIETICNNITTGSTGVSGATGYIGGNIGYGNIGYTGATGPTGLFGPTSPNGPITS